MVKKMRKYKFKKFKLLLFNTFQEKKKKIRVENYVSTLLLGHRAALGHCSRGGEAQSEVRGSLSWLRVLQICKDAGAIWFSGSQTPRHHWEPQKS